MGKKKKSGVGQKDLDKLVEQATRLGIGFAIVSKEALEDLIKKTTKEKAFSEKQARQELNKLVNESKRREKQLKAKIKKVIKEAKANSPVVPRADAVKMKAKIELLKKQLAKKKKM